MAFMEVHFPSEVLGLKTSMHVILPHRPCTRPDGRWPVLYLLHGLSDDHTVWTRKTSIERYVEEMDLAVVMPAVQRSFYADMKHGMKYWTFISQELPEICERMFPVGNTKGTRFAAGLSMGGYGALKLGLVCPGRYAAVASLSGSPDMRGFALSSDYDVERGQFFIDAFGMPDEMEGTINDLPAVARRVIASGAALPRFYMACGTEDFLYENNQGFLAEFGDALNVAYEEGPGAHTWAFWDAYIQRVLEWLPID